MVSFGRFSENPGVKRLTVSGDQDRTGKFFVGHEVIEVRVHKGDYFVIVQPLIGNFKPGRFTGTNRYHGQFVRWQGIGIKGRLGPFKSAIQITGLDQNGYLIV